MEEKQENKLNFTVTFAICYLIGIAAFFTNTILIWAFLLLVVLILGIYKNLITPKSSVFFYLIFSLAIVNCHFQIKNFDGLSEFIPSKGIVTGVVETIPTTNDNGKTKFYMKVDSFAEQGGDLKAIKAKTVVSLYDSQGKLDKIKIGDKLKIEGKLRSPMKAKNPCQFDYSNYLKSHKTFSTFSSKNQSWEIVSAPQGFGWKFLQKLNDKRSEILDIHKKYMKSPNLEVLGGVVFGDDAINPPNEIKNSFINSGLLHILAASGMNVSIIFGIWFFIGSRLKLNFRLVILVGAVLVAFYTLMTGMGPSVLRAAFMIEFVLFGKLIDRGTDSIALVFFVAFLMLLYNPAMINDVGFQLSFVVTFALMYFCPPVLTSIKNKIAEFTAGAVLIPLVAQLFASPIQMFYFNNFATYSILANIAITPLIMIISFLGFLGSIIAMIPIPFIADKTCMVFDFILNPVVTGLVKISDYFSGLPNSLLTTIHPHAFQLFLYYGILMLIGYSIRHGFKKKILCSILLMTVLFGFSFVKIPTKDCEVLVFDVGNADSFLIKTPKQKYILIDSAHGAYNTKTKGNNFSQADAIINKYLKDNGINEIDVMILTHFDSDHSGGAVDIMKTVKVKKLVLSKEKDDSNTTKTILNYVKANKINAVDAKNNEEVLKEHGLTLKTYTPDFTQDKSDNDNSTIALLSYGDFDMLFMADGGVRSFNKIKKDLLPSTFKGKIEVLKSGHHGAKNTVTNKMLKTAGIENAIVSTGFNFYGHPAKETLDTFVGGEVKYFRTDTNNAIKIKSDGKSYQVLKYNPTRKSFDKAYENICNTIK